MNVSMSSRGNVIHNYYFWGERRSSLTQHPVCQTQRCEAKWPIDSMCLPFNSRHRCFMRYACASSFHFLLVAFSLSHEICGLWRTIDETFVHNSKSWINIFELNQTTKTIKCTVMLSALECSRDPTPTTSPPSGAK